MQSTGRGGSSSKVRLKWGQSEQIGHKLWRKHYASVPATVLKKQQNGPTIDRNPRSTVHEDGRMRGDHTWKVAVRSENWWIRLKPISKKNLGDVSPAGNKIESSKRGSNVDQNPRSTTWRGRARGDDTKGGLKKIQQYRSPIETKIPDTIDVLTQGLKKQQKGHHCWPNLKDNQMGRKVGKERLHRK